MLVNLSAYNRPIKIRKVKSRVRRFVSAENSESILLSYIKDERMRGYIKWRINTPYKFDPRMSYHHMTILSPRKRNANRIYYNLEMLQKASFEALLAHRLCDSYSYIPQRLE